MPSDEVVPRRERPSVRSPPPTPPLSTAAKVVEDVRPQPTERDRSPSPAPFQQITESIPSSSGVALSRRRPADSRAANRSVRRRLALEHNCTLSRKIRTFIEEQGAG